MRRRLRKTDFRRLANVFTLVIYAALPSREALYDVNKRIPGLGKREADHLMPKLRECRALLLRSQRVSVRRYLSRRTNLPSSVLKIII